MGCSTNFLGVWEWDNASTQTSVNFWPTSSRVRHHGSGMPTLVMSGDKQLQELHGASATALILRNRFETMSHMASSS